MKKIWFLFSIITLTACGVTLKPIRINSDPNQEHLEQLEEKSDQDSMGSFIADHPDLDEKTKKELRDGTITRHEAMERLKKKQEQQQTAPTNSPNPAH